MGNKRHRSPLEEKLANLEHTPSEGVWNAISDQLDADITRSTRRTREFFAGSIGFIVLLSAIILLLPAQRKMAAYEQIGIKKDFKWNQQAIEKKTFIEPETQHSSTQFIAGGLALVQSDESQANVDPEPVAEYGEVQHNQLHELNPIPVRTAVAIAPGSEENAQFVRTSRAAFDKATDPSVIMVDRTATQATFKESSLYYDLGDTQEISSVSGFYLGASGSWNATTLLSNRPIIGLYEDGENHFRILPSKSITLGYLVNDHLAIQAEYVYNAVEGTAISTSAEAQHRVFNVSLYMDQFPVYLKFRKPTTLPVLNKHASVNLLAGLQFNRLRDYRLPQERRYEIVEEEVFRTNSLSLTGGAEIETFILPNWMLSLGLNASISQNLSPFGDPLSVYPKHSLTAGVRGGIYYFLGSGR